MKKPTKNEIYLLIGFIGVFVAVLVYFFVFRKNMERVEQLKAENGNLEERVKVLEGYEANYDQWQSEIYTMADDIDAVFAKFPADVRPEDAVYEAISIQNMSQTNILEIDYAESEQLYSPKAGSSEQIFIEAENKEREYYDIDGWREKIDWIEAIQDGEFFDALAEWWDSRNEEIADETSEDWSEEEAVEEAVDGEGAPEEAPAAEVQYDENGNPVSESGIYLVNQPVTYLASYDVSQMKSAVAYIVENYNRSVIKEINLVFDTSKGKLAGSMNVNKYYISGTDKTYEAPEFPGVSIGTDNLFATLNAPEKDED